VFDGGLSKLGVLVAGERRALLRATEKARSET
jgi:hypothetical protein